jgi:hypothetical protein
MPVGLSNDHPERHAMGLGHQTALDAAFGAIGGMGARFFPPSGAVLSAPSRLSQAQSIPCSSSNWATPACQSFGLSEDFKDLLSAPSAPPGIEQHDEQGVELFYNTALAPWCP